MKNITSLDPNSLSASQVHKILLTAVAPRPIAFASTIDAEGNVNLSPFSFFNVFSANPPIMIFSPARRVRDNTAKHTLENVKEVKEVVINTVNFPIVEQMSLSSTEYSEGVNEFEKAGFTQIPSEVIQPPRVGEAPISFECTVDKVIELGNDGGAGNLVISRVQRIHINDDYLNEKGDLDTQKLDLVARMGESWYCRANGDALFEIPKPIFNKGIGVDQLPTHVLKSTVLNGNHLGRLGNLEGIRKVARMKLDCMEVEFTYGVRMSLEDAREVLKNLHAQYPQVTVGVTMAAASHEPGKLADWAARRVSRLGYRTLSEFVGPSTEGGKYICPMGKREKEDLGRRLTFTLDVSAGQPYENATLRLGLQSEVGSWREELAIDAAWELGQRKSLSMTCPIASGSTVDPTESSISVHTANGQSISVTIENR